MLDRNKRCSRIWRSSS